ncbi:MAG: hypothetical protein AB7T10_00590 [bacterium]
MERKQTLSLRNLVSSLSLSTKSAFKLILTFLTLISISTSIYGLDDITRDSIEVLFNSRITFTEGSEKNIYEICDSLLDSNYGIGNDKGELSWGVGIDIKEMIKLYETTMRLVKEVV